MLSVRNLLNSTIMFWIQVVLRHHQLRFLLICHRAMGPLLRSHHPTKVVAPRKQMKWLSQNQRRNLRGKRTPPQRMNIPLWMVVKMTMMTIVMIWRVWMVFYSWMGMVNPRDDLLQRNWPQVVQRSVLRLPEEPKRRTVNAQVCHCMVIICGFIPPALWFFYRQSLVGLSVCLWDWAEWWCWSGDSIPIPWSVSRLYKLYYQNKPTPVTQKSLGWPVVSIVALVPVQKNTRSLTIGIGSGKMRWRLWSSGMSN